MITEIDPYSVKHAVDKRREFEAMAKDGPVGLQLDSRRPGVSVPSSCADVPNLILKFSLRYAAHLTVDENGVRQELSFKGVDFPCVVPWSAVYAIYPEKHGRDCAVWPSDVPLIMRRAFGMKPEQIN